MYAQQQPFAGQFGGQPEGASPYGQAPQDQQQQQQQPQGFYQGGQPAQGFQQPFQQQPQQQPGFQQQPQQGGYGGYGQAGGAPGGAFGETIAGFDSMASMAGNQVFQAIAKEKFTEVQGKYLPGASSYWNTLRYYFHVDNRFVLRKVKLLLFPWRHRDWARIRVRDESVDGQSQITASEFAPPVADINAPDLYLPVMAFVTYILITGFLKGKIGSFNPEVLQDTFSTCILTLLVEVLVMKGGLYSLGSASVKIAWLDLCVYAGYKYVLIALGLLFGLFLGKLVYNSIMVYAALAMAFFLYRTLCKAVPKPQNEASGHKRRFYYLVTCAALQLLAMVFLGFTRDLGETTLFLSSNAMPAAAIPDVIPGKVASPVVPLADDNDEDELADDEADV